MADENEITDERPSLQARAMAAIDAALEPAERLASTPQPMSTAHLRTVIVSFRQALSVAIYGPPAEPEEEPRVEDPAADAEASLVAGKSEPQFTPPIVEEPVANAAEPQAEASVFE